MNNHRVSHYFDNDATCIHCNFDGADWPKQYGAMPECPVWDEEKRKQNQQSYLEYQEQQHQLDNDDWYA